MRLLFAILGTFYRSIPIYSSLIFAILGLMVRIEYRVTLGSFYADFIVGAVIGFILGLIVQRIIPNPEEKTL